MAEQPPDTNQIEVRTIGPMVNHQKIYLYVLRNTSIEEKFKIKAYFNNDIKYTFNRIETVEEKSTHNPYIYRAELDLIIDNQNRLYFNHYNGLLPISYYRLRLSRKIFNTETTFRDYNDDKDRYINSPFTAGHYFIFDVDFIKNLVDSPPGYNVSFWNQLYLYTFYLLRHKMYNVFDTLIEQFQQAIQQERRILTTEEFHDFLQSCMNDLPYAISNGVNQHITDKILFRMSGVLPITKKNFDITNRDTINFSVALLSDLQEHYDKIFSTVTTEEWNLFRNGLVLYLSIEFLTQSKETIKIVHRIKNTQCKKDLANVLLQRLEEIQKPVLGLNWTELFSLVDPNILTLKQLELTRSIEIYITSLVQFVERNINEIEIHEQLKRHFDQLIFEKRLIGKILNFDFLKKIFFF